MYNGSTKKKGRESPMDEQNVASTPAPKTRRRRKTKMEVFKEAYLPYIILMTAVLLILIFIIGAVVRSSKQKDDTAALMPDSPAFSETWTI